jgi:CBS domain
MHARYARPARPCRDQRPDHGATGSARVAGAVAPSSWLTWGIPDSTGGVLAGEKGDEFLALTAGTLMSKQAITVRPDATIAGATRMMNTYGIGRLPVVDSKGKLAGIVSRRDLLSVFLRPDADIAHDVGQLLEELALVDPMGIVVRVRQYGLACCRLVGRLADECEAHAGGARRPADHNQVGIGQNRTCA